MSGIVYSSGNVPDWDLQVAVGELGERSVGAVLALDGDRDVWLVEVKDEQRSRTSLFVEHASRGRPSGIAVTRADWLAMVLPRGAIVFVPMAVARELHAEAVRRFKPKPGAEANEGASIPKRWLLGDMT